jgi:hypothetical protein
MHADWRGPQLVRQRYRRPVEAFFAGGNLLFATATHRCGKSRCGREQGAITTIAAILRSSRASSGSIRCVMPMS